MHYRWSVFLIDFPARSFVDSSGIVSPAVTALSTFRKKYPYYRADEILETCRTGIEWIKRKQRSDGSWYGSWGIVSLLLFSSPRVNELME